MENTYRIKVTEQRGQVKWNDEPHNLYRVLIAGEIIVSAIFPTAKRSILVGEKLIAKGHLKTSPSMILEVVEFISDKNYESPRSE